MAFKVKLSVRLLLAPFGLPSSMLSGFWKLSLASTLNICCLLDGPVGTDPAFPFVWYKSRTMRRYLAYRPREFPRIFRLLDNDRAGTAGHGPMHLLFHSASELGFAWDYLEAGWLRSGLPPLRVLCGAIQHFPSAVFHA